MPILGLPYSASSARNRIVSKDGVTSVNNAANKTFALVHFGLAVLAVVLLWSTSLSSCRTLANHVLNQGVSTSTRNDATEVGARLLKESQRYEHCVKRQAQTCNVTIERESAWARLTMMLEASAIASEIEELKCATVECALQEAKICEQGTNQTVLVATQENQAKVERIEELALETDAALGSFLACITPDLTGRYQCDHGQSLVIQVQDAFDYTKQVFDYNTRRAKSYQDVAQARVAQAETFIASVRNVAADLSAVGINFGVIPSPQANLPNLALAAFPNLPSAQQFIVDATAKSIIDVRIRQERVKNETLDIVLGRMTFFTSTSTASLLNSTTERVTLPILPPAASASWLSANSTWAALDVFYQMKISMDGIINAMVVADSLFRAYRTVDIFVDAHYATKDDRSRGAFLIWENDNMRTDHLMGFERVYGFYTRKFLTETIAFSTAAWAGFKAADAYRPVWFEFAWNCKGVNRSGNTLAKNAAEVMLKASSTDGARETSIQIGTAQKASSRQCNDGSAQTIKSRGELQSEVGTMQRQLDTIQNCSMELNCAYMLRKNATRLIDALARLSFDCSKFACELSCKGPNSDMVRGMTVENTCMWQGNVHSFIIAIALTTIVYACANFGRLYLIRGLVCICNALASAKQMKIGLIKVWGDVKYEFPDELVPVVAKQTITEQTSLGWKWIGLSCGFQLVWLIAVGWVGRLLVSI